MAGFVYSITSIRPLRVARHFVCLYCPKKAPYSQSFFIPNSDERLSSESEAMDSDFLDVVTADGSSGFKAEAGRYHLYACLACPFAHRAIIGRKLKGLEDVVSMTIVDPLKLEKGWKFTDKVDKCTLDPLNGCEYLSQVYQKARPGFCGRVVVPLLWDKQTDVAVNNDSGQILRMFNSAFNDLCPTEKQRKRDVCPADLKQKIDQINSWVLPKINLGVYKCGLMAKSQEDYDNAIHVLFNHLDKAEEILSKQRYLTGNRFTEADIRLFTTLIRFDWVYHTHFKCNKKMIHEYKNLWGFVRDVYQTNGISETVDRNHIITSYYGGHRHLNPLGIIPICPDLDFNEPHGRESMG